MGGKNISWSKSSAAEIVAWFDDRVKAAGDGKGGQDLMWLGRNREYFASVIPALVELRDTKALKLDSNTWDEVASARGYWALMQRPEISVHAREAMQRYLASMPGYQREKGEHQSETVEEQFSYIAMYTSALFNEATPGSGIREQAQQRIVAASRTGVRWLGYQAKEIWREIKRAARPPVTVRLHGKQVLAISTRPEFGGGLVLMPLSGNCGVVAAAWSETVSANAPKAFGVEVWNDVAAGERQIWPVGEFPDRETAEEVVERIRKPLTGSTWGKWVFRAAVLWIALIAVRAWFNAPAPQGAGAQAATASAVPGSALLQLMGPGGMGGSDSPSLAALAGDAGGGARGGGSLADDIYNEAMAAQRQSMHEQGPPQTPSPDIDLKSFGLAGGKNGEGCDPKLAFKVEP